MNRSDRGILLGMIFGDGHINPSSRCNTATLTIKHGIKQREYAEHKAKLLSITLGGVIPPISEINNSGYPGCVLYKTNSYLRILRDWLYVGGRKTISPYIKWLSEEGLAIWYMDDGGLGRKIRRGKVHAVDTIINCHTTLDEAQKICAKIEQRFGIKFVPNRNNGSYRIRCGTIEGRKFASIIAPFIHSSMKYKLLANPEEPTSPRP